MERLSTGDEAQLRDLVRAGGDDEAKGGLVIDESGFEGDAGVGVAGQFVERVVIEDQLDHRGDAVAQGRDALAHGVQGEEVAQDDPEPVH
ncbi:MAG: hypothetical protein B7Y90_05385, partial [Alphaproteobacteria bacterium 32-64-14]